MTDSTCCQHLWFEVPGLPETAKTDFATGPDGQDGEGGVLEGNTQPGLRRQLESPADEISNDVCVTHHDLHAVLALTGVGSVEILPR